MNRSQARARRLLSSICACGALVASAPAHSMQQAPGAQSEAAKRVEPVITQDGMIELSLEKARELALLNNYGLQIESISTEVAFFSFKGSFGVYDWNLAAQANVINSQFKPNDVFPGSFTNTQAVGFDVTRLVETGGTFKAHFDTSHVDTDSAFAAAPSASTDTFSLGFVQPLLRGAWRQYTTANQRIADLDWQRQGEHERQVRQKLIFDVSLAYWDLVAAREQLKVAESSLELAHAQIEQDRRRLEAGVGTELDVLQAEAKAATREQDRLQADVRVRQAMDTLKSLVFPGKNPAVWDAGVAPMTLLPAQVSAEAAPSWNAALGVALERRSELRQQRELIAANTVRLEQRQSEKLPGLDLTFTAGSVGFATNPSEALGESLGYDFPTYTAALNFTFPLENTAARYAEKAAWASVRAARLEYADLESQIVADVRFAVRQVVYQVEAVHAAAKTLELARRQLKGEQDRRESGTSTNFQVLQFQQDLAEALSSEITARANYVRALVALEQAQGTLGEPVNP
jgi:outer membrane protein TolC